MCKFIMGVVYEKEKEVVHKASLPIEHVRSLVRALTAKYEIALDGLEKKINQLEKQRSEQQIELTSLEGIKKQKISENKLVEVAETIEAIKS